MRFSPSLVALVAAGLASAQLPNIPQCSLNCFVSALSSDGCSSLTDFACHCAKPQLITEVTPCVEKACPVSDQKAVSSLVVSECSAAGHPVTIPPIGGGGATATKTHDHTHTKSASESSATPSGSASSSPAVSTPAASSTPAVGTGGATPSSTTPGSPVFTGAAGRTEGSLVGVALAAVMGGLALV